MQISASQPPTKRSRVIERYMAHAIGAKLRDFIYAPTSHR